MGAALAMPHQIKRLAGRGDSAPGSQLRAIQSSHGVGKFERVPQGCSLEHRITERSVKHVSRTGGVDASHHESGRVYESPVFPCKCAVRTQGHSGDSHLMFVLNTLERAERIALAGPPRWKFGAPDQIVCASEYLVEARIDVVDIATDWDGVIARDAGGACDGGRVVPIHVQHPAASDLLRGDLGW